MRSSQISAGDVVLRAKLLQSLEEQWLTLPGTLVTKDQYIPAGPDAGRDFELVFLGPPAPAARRARRTNLLLRKTNRELTKVFTEDAEGTTVYIFVSADKSPKKKRQHVLGKRLFRCFGEIHSDETFTFRGWDKAILYKGQEIARVEAKSFRDFDVFWCKFVEQFGITKGPILEKFSSSSGLGPGVTWSL